MRISDWSSDVCSSDLASRQRRRLAGAQEARSARQATEQNVVGHGKAPWHALRWRPAIECQLALRPAFAPQIDDAVLVLAPVALNDPVSALDGGAAYFAAGCVGAMETAGTDRRIHVGLCPGPTLGRTAGRERVDK